MSVIERRRRGSGGVDERDERVEQQAQAILERSGCSWLEAWAQASAVADRDEGEPGAERAAPPRRAPGRLALTTMLPARVMRSAQAAEVDPDAAALIQRARGGGGTALEAGLRAALEAALGAPLDDVRVHTGGDADAAARAVGARAFALGQDVFFRDGAYDPGRPDGQRLIAHEVAHTVQARGTAAPGDGLTVSQPGDASEREADAFADTFVGRLLADPVPRRHAAAAVHRAAPARAFGAVSPGRVLRDPPTDTGGRGDAPLRAGDHVRFTMTMASDGSAVGAPDQELVVRPDGALEIVALDAVVPVAGLTLSQASARLSTELSRRARVAIRAELARPGAATTDTGAAQTEEAALDRFRAYLAVIREPAEAIARYRQWIEEHRGTPELLTTSPAEVWRLALQQPSRATDPYQDRLELYLRYMRDQQERIRQLPDRDERIRELGVLMRFQEWFDRHQRQPIVLRTDPGTIYGQLSSGAQIRDIERRAEREVARQREAALSSPAASEARTRKFDEFYRLALRLWGYSAERFPYRIPIDVEGRDILVTGHPALQAVLTALANDFMDWAVAHLNDPTFATSSPQQVLGEIFQTRGYGPRLTAAQTTPLESESIDRHEIVPGRALAAFGETVATGMLVIALVGAAVGAGIITGGAALVVLAGVAGYAGISSYLARRDEIEREGYDVPVPETMLASVGDIVGLSQLIEGITGERLGTGRRLSSVQRSDQLGTGGGNVTLLLTGSRAYRGGERFGAQFALEQMPRRVPAHGPEVLEPEPARAAPVRAEPSPNPGPLERALREALPEELRSGFDDWMAEIRRNGGEPERALERIRAEQRGTVARRQAERRTQALADDTAAAERSRRIADVAASDPLRPALRHREVRDGVVVRYESRPGSVVPEDVQFGSEIARQSGEPVELFGDTPRGLDYPGIDGVIGNPPRPLSLKRGAAGAHPNYARWASEEAYAAATRAGYSHVEVHVQMHGHTRAQVQAAWDAPPPLAEQVAGRELFGNGTVARIVVHCSDGLHVVEPPLPDPALTGTGGEGDRGASPRRR